MQDLIFYNIYTVIFLKCEFKLFDYFRKNLLNGFILEQVIDINHLRSELTEGRFFLIVDSDHLKKEEMTQLNTLINDNIKKYILYFGNNESIDAQGFSYLKNDNESKKALNYVTSVREQEIYKSIYSNLVESIEYAGKIQRSILPNLSLFNKYFSEYFIYNKPRDIVSGDFYWLANVNDLIYVAVGDCTGHGVPGAFMSILGITLLNEIIYVDGIYETNNILNNLRENIIKSLSQSFEGGDLYDGMDIALCAFRPEYDIMQFSGAFSPVLIIRDDELIELDADRMPVGIFIKDDVKFSSQYFDLKKNDQIYMFSDGFCDQIGGVQSKKLRRKRFYNFLFENRKVSLKEQNELIERFMKTWKGSNEQIDDMLIAGLKI